MTQPVVALLDTSEDLMQLPSRASDSGPDTQSRDTWEVIDDAIHVCIEAQNDRDNRSRTLEEARRLIDQALEMHHAEEMRRTRGRA